MVRTPTSDKNGLKKGTWSPEEDRRLTAYISRYGCWNWRQLPKFAGLSRCGKSCRLRWLNYLRPNIKRGNFSKEEEEIIINLHDSLGNRWSAIAAKLPGRTDNEIKNHWHSYLKKRSRHVSISQGEKPSSSDRSKRKSSREKRRSDVSNSSINPSTHQQIFESSQFSQPPSSTKLCCLTMDTAEVNFTSLAAECHDVSPPNKMFAETNGSFWSEPFLADNCDEVATYDVLAPLLDTGFLSPPYSPIISEEFLCSYGFYDKYNNVFNW